MESEHKILVLDDDADWLEMSRDILSQLPSKPEIRTATSGKRALAMLDAEPFRLLICDLKMPRIDGLQVLTIVRRRFPELRTVVLSGLEDDEFRSRAYALGVDMFWLKTEMQGNLQMYLECLESLLGRDQTDGFRGIQSKGLMDIVQMECLARSSTVLRITRGSLVGKLWIKEGELVDAEAEGARGETAFLRILTWKSGTFENLPAEPNRERTIFKAVNALLLESAQAIDEKDGAAEASNETVQIHRHTVWKLSLLTRAGAEFIVAIPPEGQGEHEAMGTDAQTAGQYAQWARRATAIIKRMGDTVDAGPLLHLEANNVERRLLLIPGENKNFMVGWSPEADGGLFEKTKKLVASWDS
jgi:CheY-like chemotaxis protein